MSNPNTAAAKLAAFSTKLRRSPKGGLFVAACALLAASCTLASEEEIAPVGVMDQALIAGGGVVEISSPGDAQGPGVVINEKWVLTSWKGLAERHAASALTVRDTAGTMQVRRVVPHPTEDAALLELARATGDTIAQPPSSLLGWVRAVTEPYCKLGSSDLAHCLVAVAPPGTRAFVWNNGLYYSAAAGADPCPVKLPGTFLDPANNCYLGPIPEGNTGFAWNNALYIDFSFKARQDVIQTATVDSGYWGDWSNPAHCPVGTFATGYRLRAQPDRAKILCQSDASYPSYPVAEGSLNSKAYVVSPNAFGVAGHGGKLCLDISTNGDFRIAENTSAALNYPNSLKGQSYGNQTVKSGMPIQVKAIQNWPIDWDIETPSTGKWNAALEFWMTTKQPTGQVDQADGTELMIWLDANEGFTPYGQSQGEVVIAGTRWQVIVGRAHWGAGGSAPKYWNYVAYRPAGGVRLKSFHGDAKLFMDDAKTRTGDCRTGPDSAAPDGAPSGRCLYDDWWVTSVQAGFEVAYGGVGLASKGFNSNINQPTPLLFNSPMAPLRLPQNPADGTALNTLDLICQSPARSAARTIKAHDGLFGNWYAPATCAQGFLNGARVRNQTPVSAADDTSTNDVEFACGTSMLHAPGALTGGSFGSMTYCPAGTAVCGASLRVEGDVGAGDNTALNGLRLECCALPPVHARMTSASSPAPLFASTSASFDGYPGWAVFDGKSASLADPHWVASLPASVRLDLGAASRVGAYRLVGRYDSLKNRLPRKWVLEGSNDRTTWTVLDERAGVLTGSAAGWLSSSNMASATFKLATPATYASYRLRVSEANGSDAVDLYEVELLPQ
jgi:hypothetical protein